MFCKLNTIAIVVFLGISIATMAYSQQLQVNSNSINLNPPGASCNLQVINNSGDPAIVPAWASWGTVGSYSNPFWWVYATVGTINEIYYYDLFSMSDSSEKENITNVESVLNKIMNVRSVRFDYKADQNYSVRTGKNYNNNERKNRIGFIAQELQNQFPEMVKLDSATGKKRVNYIEMIPVLLKAVQELKAIVDKQDSTIADLTRKVAAR